MSVFRVFVRNELWIKLPVAIFFGAVDCSLAMRLTERPESNRPFPKNKFPPDWRNKP